NVQVVGIKAGFGGPPETRTPDPLIKSRATPRTSAYMRRQAPSISIVRYLISSALDEVVGYSTRTKGGHLPGVFPAGGLIHNQQGRKKLFCCKLFPLGCP